MTREQGQGIYITQEDIDAVLKSAPPSDMMAGQESVPRPPQNNAASPESGLAAESEDGEYSGTLSQEDIETLLQGDLDGLGAQQVRNNGDIVQPAASPTGDIPSPESNLTHDNESVELESLKDPVPETGAGAVVGETAETGVETEAGTSEEVQEVETVSQDDIDRLLLGALDDGEDDVGIVDESGSPEADSDETGNILSQDDLDNLLAGMSENDGGGGSLEAEAVEADLVPAIDVDTEPVETGVSPEPVEEESSLVPQSDSVELADDADASPKKSEHITQDDINRLLKESTEETESISASIDDPPDTDDSEGADMSEAAEKDAEAVPADPEPVATENTLKSTGKDRRKWGVGPSVIVWAASAACVVLLVAITALVISSLSTEVSPPVPVLTFSLEQTGEELPDAQKIQETSIPLAGFVVFAPPNPADITYVVADLTLEIADTATTAAIKENEAFVRDVIYGAILHELMTQDIATIDEVRLEKAIREALGGIVTHDVIDRVAFDRFSLV